METTGLPDGYSTPNVTSRVNSSRVILPQIYVDMLNDKTAAKLALPIVYVAVMMVVGVVGNILVIYIYGFRWHRATTRVFITTLAILDLVNCVITMPTEIAVLRNFYYLDAAPFCKLSRFSTFWMNNNSSVVLLIIGIDRYLKICMPNKKTFTYRGSKIACIVAVTIGFAVSWPGLFLYGNQTKYFPTKHGLMKFILCSVQDGMENTWYPMAYYIYLWCGFLGTALVMIILYSLIGAQIWIRKGKKDKRSDSLRSASLKLNKKPDSQLDKASTQQGSNSGSVEETSATDVSEDVFQPMNEPEPASPTKRKSRPRLPTVTSIKISKSGLEAGKATLMLFVITVVFVISFLPFLVISVLRTLRGSLWYPSLSDGEKVAVNLFLRSYLVSNTVNPIIYGFCNVQFRRECARLFRKMTCRKRR